MLRDRLCSMGYRFECESYSGGAAVVKSDWEMLFLESVDVREVITENPTKTRLSSTLYQVRACDSRATITLLYYARKSTPRAHQSACNTPVMSA